MSEIPVGTPPVPPGRHAAPGGWYADPVDPAQERYWDGWQWSRTTRPRTGAPAGGPVHTGVPTGAPSDRPGQYPWPGDQRSPQPAYSARAGLRPTTTADGIALAGWWWRVLATAIDNLLLNVVVSLLTFPITAAVVRAFQEYLQQVVAAQSSGDVPPQPDITQLISTQDTLILGAVGIAVGIAYRMVFLRYRGATLGKLACGLRVVPVDQGRFHGRLGWAQVAIRAAIWVVPGAVNYLSLILLVDALLPLWQPKRQALHDLAARTQVIRPGYQPPTAR